MGHRRIHFVRAVAEVETNSVGEIPQAHDEKLSDIAKGPVDDRLIMVETTNFVQQDFETTDELKALTQEVIKTIRDIIVSPIILAKRDLLSVLFNPLVCSDLRL